MVKALDSKSNGLCPRRFESCSVRIPIFFFFSFFPTFYFFSLHIHHYKQTCFFSEIILTYLKIPFFCNLLGPLIRTVQHIAVYRMILCSRNTTTQDINNTCRHGYTCARNPTTRRLTYCYFLPPDKLSRSTESFHWSMNTTGCSQTTATPHKQPA